MKRSDLQDFLVKEDWPALYAAAFNQRWSEGLNMIPHHMWRGVAMWAVFGIKPGNFLQAVIRGDLFDAAARADGTNQQMLYEWAFFMHNYIPSEAKGPKALGSWTGVKLEEEIE
jgi:hypothetical protein